MKDSRKILAVVLLGCVLLNAFGGNLEKFNAYYYDIAVSIGINIILAVGLNLLIGHTGQFSLGHAGFMAVGAYTSAILTIHLFPSFLAWSGGTESGLWAKLFFATALLTGGLGAAVIGLVVGIPSLRLRGDYLAIVTLGFGEIIRVVILNIDFLGASRGLSIKYSLTDLFWCFSMAAVTVYVVANLVNSTYGRGFIAVRDNEIAAEAMGINSTKYKVIAFVFAAFFAGIAGGLYAHYKQFIAPEGFNFFKSVDVVVMVIVGGMGSTAGVILAAVFLTLLPELLRYLSHLSGLPAWAQPLLENRLILYSLLLIILMIVRPQGLFGEMRWFGKLGKRATQ